MSTSVNHFQRSLELRKGDLPTLISKLQEQSYLKVDLIVPSENIRINEIGHFTRVIPDDVIDKMEKAEELKVFDNYYILHYDPSGAANIFYEPKDPIMFGVIHGSDKLYFVADWIDKFCNLTYKDILEKGKDFTLTPPTA